ncbi:MAG: HAMP domain-containing sensor histidine kinase [Hyphomonas sp.]|nr:HAMP domain-containing histidine kinase [Hyphomonas sp.]MCB9961602.1 HAMP domain-containing histidine kinase [Hyphomonas sp.]MCB9971159.1 HAMP domain-containing histidine kinase [Hyphomonas sp.]
MKSIAGKLLFGLVVSGIIGGIVLGVLVTYQYGLLGRNPPPLNRTILEITEHVIVPVGVFLFLFGTGALLVVRRVEAQLKATARDVCQAAQELRSYQTPGDALPTELKPLTDAVNVLTERLEAHARRQEAFAADAAHELKTPLAVLAVSLDRLPTDEAAPLRAQVRALSEMVDQLLLLARSNSPDLVQRRSLIEPGALARRVVAELAPAAFQAGRSLSVEEDAAKPFHGLEEAVAASLRTLVVNALRAAPDGAEVVVKAGPGASLTVIDGGTGLASDELERLKARGIRADRAPGGAAGLGLAIADRIAEAHGGELVTCLPECAGLSLHFPEVHAA